MSANAGTLFLDEVGEIPPDLQARLLRVLESKKVRPVGSDIELGPVDFRLVSATNRDLRQMVQEKAFREDLFYRICAITLELPSLAKHLDDVTLLADHFAHPKKLSAQAIELLRSVEKWPGNVRQLRSVVENASNLTVGYDVSEELIAKQLEYQRLLQQSPGLKQFYEIKARWESKHMSDAELEELLNSRFLSTEKSWTEVGKQLGMRSLAERKAFRNWIAYTLRRKGLKLERDSE